MKITVGGFPVDPEQSFAGGKYKEIWDVLKTIPTDSKTGVGAQWIAIRNITKDEARKMQPSFNGGYLPPELDGFKCSTHVRHSEITGDDTWVLWLRKKAAKINHSETLA